MRKCVICGRMLRLVPGQFCNEHRRVESLWLLVERGIRSDWYQSIDPETKRPIPMVSHAEMQVSAAWTLEPHGMMGAFGWQAELASILAWKGVRLDG